MSHQVYKSKKSKYYQISVRIEGDRRRFSSKTTNRVRAEQKAVAEETRLFNELHGIKDDMTVHEALDYFLKATRHKKSHDSDVGRARITKEYLPATLAIRDLHKSALIDFQRLLKESEGVKQNTVIRYFALLKAAINLAKADEVYSGENPVYKVRLKKVTVERSGLGVDQLQSILEYAFDLSARGVKRTSRYFYAFLYLALNTGMRAGEIFNLKWQDVTPNSIRIRDPKSGKEEEFIPCLPWLYDFIQSLPKESFFVIDTNVRRSQIFHRLWYRMLADLGISRAVIHTLRHSFASYLAEQGVPPTIVQALLRHADLKTTQIYLHSNMSQMREALNKLEPVFAANAPHRREAM